MTALNAPQRAAVAAQALTWLGTPYHACARVLGVGVDCAQLLCAVYPAAGVIAPVDPGPYAPEHHLHRSEELYIGWLQRCGAQEVQTPALGDVALFRFGRTWSHGAIVVDAQGPQLVHAYVGLGTVLTRLDEAPLAGRPVRWWSLWCDGGGA